MVFFQQSGEAATIGASGSRNRATPASSQRGRTITHAHYFDLGDAPFPVVQADDDAALVQWTPIDQLARMEEEFFEDHFHMLDHFLGLTELR